MPLASRMLTLNLATVDVRNRASECRDAVSSCDTGTDQQPGIGPDCGDSSCPTGTDAQPEPPPDCGDSSCPTGTDQQPTQPTSRASAAVKRAIRRQMHAARR